MLYFVKMNDKTIPQLLRRISSEYPSVVAQYSRNESGRFDEMTFAEAFKAVLDYMGGLLSIGCTRGDHIGLIADNRKEWLHSSMAIMGIGAADVPRGCDATEHEIRYILSFAGCKTAVLENEAQAKKVLKNKDGLPELKTLIFMDMPQTPQLEELKKAGYVCFSYTQILELGSAWRTSHDGTVEAELENGNSSEIATIIFTSGTTGEPKGVMLTHGNFICQLPDLSKRIILYPGEKALSVLPVWHSFERLCEYMIINLASGIIYSKPIGSILLADFALMNPQLLPSVPRIWESVHDGIFRAMRKTGGITWKLFSFFVAVAKIHAKLQRALNGRYPVFSQAKRVFAAIAAFIPWLLLYPIKALGGILVFKKIKAKLGNAFRGGVSGGGALPPNVDEFFWAVGVKVVEGYGLTETAPVVSVRPFTKPVFGTIGKQLDCCIVKIVDDEGKELPPGKKGTVMIKGDNVMKGYYKREDLTAKVLSADGWLDTGDLGYKTIHGEIILKGRKKDTIVLRGGENLEPVPIEMKINESRFVQQSVVVGQDQRYIAALIIPNKEELEAWAAENNTKCATFSELLLHPSVQRLFEMEVAERVSQKNGFKIFERINRFTLLEKPFEPGVELSAKQEVMRHKIQEIYAKQIERMFSRAE